MSNECIPYFADFTMDTFVCGTGGLGGKRFVTNQGALTIGLGNDGGVPGAIIPATAGISVSGVASQDMAAGSACGVFIRGTVPVTCSANLTAGTKVMTDATGYATPLTGTNNAAGTCLADTASGADAMIRIG
jgi:predicted RecA/RadA family phage recombinase